MPFSSWFERIPDLVDYERAAYAREEFDFTLQDQILTRTGTVVFEGQLDVAGKTHTFQVIYPSGFPYVRPEVVCKTAELPRHQAPYSRNVCVAPFGPDEWRFGRDTGASLVREAIRLLEASAEGPQAVAALEIDAPEPASVYYEYSQCSAFIVLEEPPTVALNEQGFFRFALDVTPGFDGVRATLLEVQRKPPHERWTLPDAIRKVVLGSVHEGIWVSYPEPPPFLPIPDAKSGAYRTYLSWLSEINSDVDRFTRSRRGKGPHAFAVRYPNEGPLRGQYHENWLVGVTNGTRTGQILLRPFFFTHGDQFQRLPQLSALKQKKVAIVGLGALGSSIAIDLTRAGVGHFWLIDHDVVDAAPLVRQAYDLGDVGLPKSLALMLKLRQINPRATFDPLQCRVGAANLKLEGEKDALVDIGDRLATCDILISAVGHTATDRVLNELSRFLGIPAIFTWVLNGAWGGRVFRALPDGPCYECLERAWESYPQPNEDPSETVIFGRGCGFPSFTGTGFDGGANANLATRLAVQTLLSADANGYPDALGNLVTWSSRADAAADLPSIQHSKVESHADCWVCKLYGGQR